MSNQDTASFRRRNLRKSRRGDFNPDSSFIARETDLYLKSGGKVTKMEDVSKSSGGSLFADDLQLFFNPSGGLR